MITDQLLQTLEGDHFNRKPVETIPGEIYIQGKKTEKDKQKKLIRLRAELSNGKLSLRQEQGTFCSQKVLMFKR